MEKKNDSYKISNTYIPGVSPDFILNSIDKCKDDMEIKDLSESNTDGSDLIEWGLSDKWKQNKWYKSLLDKLNLKKIDNQAIMNTYRIWLFPNSDVVYRSEPQSPSF